MLALDDPDGDDRGVGALPITMTVSPGATSAERTAEPKPVGTAQPSSAAARSGMLLSILTMEAVDAVVYSLKVEMPHCWPTGSPSRACIRKLVGSSARAPVSTDRPDVAIPATYAVSSAVMNWSATQPTSWKPS